jgi:uncharacterized protein (TIGR03000 family)
MTTRRLLLFAPLPVLLFALAGNAEAGIFHFTPKDYSYGPYDGGEYYSYATAYHYLLPFSSAGYPNPWKFPLAGFYYPDKFWRTGRPFPLTPRGPVGYHAAPLALQPVPTVPGVGCASIEVAVPADAEVWVDDHKTAQTGPTRQFETPTIPPGEVFQYELRARWQQDGRTVEQSRTLFVIAGGSARVVFP